MRARRTMPGLLTFASLILITGCSKSPETPIGPSPSSDNVVYTAIGASDAVGYGSSTPCLPFDPDCPSGNGYVYVLKRRLQSTGKTVALNNRGVPGAVMSPAIQQLTRQIGRDDVIANFMDQEVPFVPTSTTHVTIFAGGNDANAIAQAIRAGQAGNDIRGFIDRQVQQWGADFDEMIKRIRARSPNARIVAYNLPNLAALPYVSRNTIDERSVLQRIAVGLSDRINAMSGQNVLVVDLLCEPRLYNGANVSSDGFHPNDQGYQLMADLGYAAVAEGRASTPLPSCPPRTLFPAF